MNSCPLIPPDWEMPSVFRFRLGLGPGRQRTMEHEGQLLLVLHDVPKYGDRNRTGQLFWRDAEGTWRSTIAGDGATAMERYLRTFTAEFDYLLADFEKANVSRDFFDLISKLSPLVRTTKNMHSALQKAREAERDDQNIINWRDEAYTLMRRGELLQSDAKSALDFEIAQQAEAQAEASHQMAVSAHRLNLLAAFFFPLATISTIFGMQLTHGLEDWDKANRPWLLLIVLALGLLMGVGLTMLITKPTKRPRIEEEEDNDR